MNLHTYIHFMYVLTYQFELLKGAESVINAIEECMISADSSIYILLPIYIPEIMKHISEIAQKKEEVKIRITGNWSAEHAEEIKPLLELGNVEIRQLGGTYEYIVANVDFKQLIFATFMKEDEDVVGYSTDHPSYLKLFSNFIGPVFMANSRKM